jgi:uncharacterized membrane protein YgdD (TMEM256/DUF423 family)
MADFLKRGLITVGVLGGTAVSLGALGAHALKNQLSGGLITEEQLAGFDTGVRYQMYHALAMLILLALHQFRPSRNLRIAFRLFLWGVILFSVSLYLLCTRGLTGMEGLRVFGPITPIGGLLMVAGWLFLVAEGFKKS